MAGVTNAEIDEVALKAISGSGPFMKCVKGQGPCYGTSMNGMCLGVLGCALMVTHDAG